MLATDRASRRTTGGKATRCETLRSWRTVVVCVVLTGCGWIGGSTLPARERDHHLIDATGFSLYTFDRDPEWSGTVHCIEACAGRFPPFAAPPGAHRVKEYRILVRPDGTRQWTYQGRPLYRFSGDRQPGDTAGDGDADLWRLARP